MPNHSVAFFYCVGTDMEWSIDKRGDVLPTGEVEDSNFTSEDLLLEILNQLKIITMHLEILNDEEIGEL